MVSFTAGASLAMEPLLTTEASLAGLPWRLKTGSLNCARGVGVLRVGVVRVGAGVVRAGMPLLGVQQVRHANI